VGTRRNEKKELEKKLDLEAEEAAEDGGEKELVVLSWADFLGVVERMRRAQTRCFKTRDREDLVKSKTLERVADKASAAIKAARGARDAGG
jgi:predicted house-cleaning noncanonical NTP pyrophosphatase (MazG superfamily)